MTRSNVVTEELSENYLEITAILNGICTQLISEEYAKIVRKAAHALCCILELPIKKVTVKTWAFRITHSVGMVNFLFDSSQEGKCTRTV